MCSKKTPKDNFNNSYFISFEGNEGAGKSTQISLFAQYLSEKGYTVMTFREPGGTDLGEKLRSILKSPDAPRSAITQTLLFTAARCQLLEEKVIPALKKSGTIVILDRYYHSTLVYQGIVGGVSISFIEQLHAQSPLNLRPDIIFYLRIPTEISLKRLALRSSSQKKIGHEECDYFDSQGRCFIDRINQGMERVIEESKDHFEIIDGAQTQNEVYKDICNSWEKFSQ